VSRSTIAGQEIKLRTRFKDDLGYGAQASDVWLHIFQPSTPITEDGSGSYFSTGSDYEYIGEGIYQYGFTPPDGAAEGTWTDLWSGILNGQLVSGEFTFEVYGGGAAEEIGDQLSINNLVEVVLSSGIMASDGTYLTDGYSFQFLTTTSPSYTNIRKVKLEVGGFINQLPDLTIQIAILEASLEADQLDFTSQNSLASKNTAFFQHARREWTTCKVALGLIDNITTSGLKSKTLGDLHVEYDTNAVFKTMERIVACLSKWEPQIMAGGYAKDAQQPRGVIKGQYDPERPHTGRVWEPMDSPYSDPFPAANTEGKRSPSHERYRGLYKKGKRFW
jgi:hypothetical protein